MEPVNAAATAFRWCPGRIVQKAWNTVPWPPFDMLAGKADVYHFTNFLLPPLRRGRSVVSIYDVGFLRMPHTAEARNLRYLTARLDDTVRRADAIVTISRFSAGEIETLLSVDAKKIHMIYVGISPAFKRPGKESVEAMRRQFNLDKPYVLFVGTLEPRKNIPFLVEVFEKMTGFDGYLVIAGSCGWKYEPILEAMKQSSRAAGIRHIGYVPDEQLPALYAGAEAFLYPSLYEGFGMPPLEAMACGTPVVSSSAASMPEALGDAAMFVDDFDAALWAKQAMSALGNAAMGQKGPAQAAKFTWQAAASSTWNLYRKLADG
jgi:glycosyltransferase involved in cell wall biosynthesis